MALRKGIGARRRPGRSVAAGRTVCFYAGSGALEIIDADSGSARVAYTPVPGSGDPSRGHRWPADDGRTRCTSRATTRKAAPPSGR